MLCCIFEVLVLKRYLIDAMSRSVFCAVSIIEVLFRYRQTWVYRTANSNVEPVASDEVLIQLTFK